MNEKEFKEEFIGLHIDVAEINERLGQLRVDTDSNKICLNTLQYSNDQSLCRSSGIEERLERLEKKVDVLCEHFAFLFTQFDEAKV